MTREKAYEIIDRCPICTECDASFPYNCDECGEAFLTAFDALKQPEIIRCKDCKRRGTYDCPVYVGGDGMSSEPDDWFCADGERKEGEQDG